jgi:hypothetical protein
MSNELIAVLSFFWIISAIYVMVYHGRRWRLGLDIIIGAIILGPILALLIGDDEERILKEKQKKERETNDRHRKWFQTLGLINRSTIPGYGRTIPPPPPISQVRRPTPDEVRAEWRRQNGINNLKDFKFFRGDKNR